MVGEEEEGKGVKGMGGRGSHTTCNLIRDKIINEKTHSPKTADVPSLFRTALPLLLLTQPQGNVLYTPEKAKIEMINTKTT